MDKLTLLEKGDTRLGILTQAGGRPVFLSRNQSPNLLQADAKLWDPATESFSPAGNLATALADGGKNVTGVDLNPDFIALAQAAVAEKRDL